MHSLQGVLLDIDGTLLDSNDAHALAWVDALDEIHRSVPYASIRPLIGMGGDKVLATCHVRLAPQEEAHLSDRRTRIFLDRYLPQVRPQPGARDLLLYWRGLGMRLVVATSANGRELDALLRASGVDDLIDDAATASDAAETKPSPDIVAAAIARSRLGAGELVLLGDTPYDIEAARRANVATIALRCGGHSDAALKGAKEIYDSPKALLQALRREGGRRPSRASIAHPSRVG